MKSLLITTLFLFSANSFAMKLSCEGTRSKTTIRLQAANLVGDWMKDVVASYTAPDYTGALKTTVGRSAQLDSDSNYKPTKFLDTKRYDLSKMTEVTKFGTFTPGDQCTIKVLIPNNAELVRSFKAHTILSCDQGGGSMELDCNLSL